MADVKRGYKMLSEMARWESYADTDAVLHPRQRGYGPHTPLPTGASDSPGVS